MTQGFFHDKRESGFPRVENCVFLTAEIRCVSFDNSSLLGCCCCVPGLSFYLDSSSHNFAKSILPFLNASIALSYASADPRGDQPVASAPKRKEVAPRNLITHVFLFIGKIHSISKWKL